jgi:hypothetical protein
MKVVIFFDRSNVINIGVGECTILSDHWYTRGIMYEIPTTFTVNALIQCMQENVSIQSDSIDVINELLLSKTFHRRSCYGYKKIQGEDVIIPSDCDDEVVEILLL